MQRPYDAMVAGIANGDRAAFRALYDQLGPQILGYLTRMLGDAQLAQDVVQDVFLTIWRRASSFDPLRASAKTWVFAIARNRAVDRLRRLQVRRASPDDPHWVVPEPSGPHEQIEDEQDAQRVQAALTELPTAQQEVLRRSFFAFQSYPEIAAELNVAVGTVKSRARLGFQRLRQLLEEE